MGVYIPKMEMPTRCEKCDLAYDDDGYFACPFTKAFYKSKRRPSWCPLVEVKPHGRLIDAEALNELIDSGDDIDFSEVPETKYAIMRMVNEQDTILEASPYRYKMIGKTDKPHGIYFIESEEEE